MAVTRDSIGDIWGERRPFVGEWSERADNARPSMRRELR
jgi:hypothetical protein